MKAIKRKLHNLGTILKYLKFQKAYIVFNVLCLLVSACKSVFVVLFSKIIIDAIAYGENIARFIICVGIYISILIIVSVVSAFLEKKRTIFTEQLAKTIEIDVCERLSRLSVEQLESSEIRNDIVLVKDSQFLLTYINLVYGLFSQFVSIISYIAIIITLDYKVIIMILAMILVKAFSQVKEVKAWDTCREETSSLSRQGLYISNFGMDPGGAKEVRINRLEKWFSSISKEINKKASIIFNKEFRMVLVFKVISILVYAAQLLYSYYYFATTAIADRISIGTYSMYITAIVAFTQGLGNLAQIVSDFKKNEIQLVKLEKLTQIELVPETKEQLCELSEEFSSIELKNLWFKYPSSSDYILKGINLCIKAGEKISIVGINGAGKTTLIKLLCRFYKPTRGKILINGKDIQEISITSYYKYISVVFQDYKLFPFSIEENIKMGNDGSSADIIQISKQANIYNRILNSEKGFSTSIYRLFDDKGIDFSGGEQQRLVLARSLYKQSPIMILDEPTSKLDAVAEYDFYKTVEEITSGKTVIYISHRLSGASLCERAIVLENGEVIQDGAPDLLMSVDGKYREMFYKQSVGYM